MSRVLEEITETTDFIAWRSHNPKDLNHEEHEVHEEKL